jgi:hypothetical protein
MKILIQYSLRFRAFMASEYSRSDPDPQVQWLENCFSLPACDPKAERVQREILQLFAQPEIQQRLLEKGRILKPMNTHQLPKQSPEQSDSSAQTFKQQAETDSCPNPSVNQVLELGLRELTKAIQALFRLT